MPRIAVKPEVLDWAVSRSGKDRAKLTKRFAKLSEWESGEVDPTLRQLEDFAKATHTPLGYLFLDQPPEDKLPIRDFRTASGHVACRPAWHVQRKDSLF